MRNAVEIGLIAALTLGVLGGSRELILADYLKSNEALDHNMAVIDLMHEHNGTTSVLTKEERRISNLVTADVMNATLDFIEEKGSITACKCSCTPLRLAEASTKLPADLESIGFGEEDVQRLASVLLVDGSPARL